MAYPNDTMPTTDYDLPIAKSHLYDSEMTDNKYDIPLKSKKSCKQTTKRGRLSKLKAHITLPYEKKTTTKKIGYLSVT
jgi:hypothetical protein